MILKSAVFISALKAAYKELGMTATYAQLAGLSFKATAGQFMTILHKFDETSAADVPVLNFFKTLTDVPGAAEDATLQFFKVLAENGVVTDDQIVSFFKVVPETVLTSDVPAKTLVKTPQDLSTASENFAKSTTHPHADSAGATESFIKLLTINQALSDTSSSTDALASAFSTERNDAAAVTDSETTAMVKFLTNTAFATDDVDGSSTIEDDQEMQFFKNSTDGVGATDVFVRVLTIGAFLADTAAATDAGLLRSQNYSDFTYFDGDYVGISRALT